jgi:putative membrane protein
MGGAGRGAKDPVRSGPNPIITRDCSMDRTTRLLIGIVAFLHFAFLVAELFFWETLTPILGLYDPAAAALTAPLGRNCGLYNGILAGAFVWLLTARSLSPQAARSLAIYLLVSVVVAGLYGGVMLKPTIPLFQSLPAVVALAQLWRTAGRTAAGG